MSKAKEVIKFFAPEGCYALFVVAFIVVLFLLVGCKAQKVVERVEVPVPIIQEHTIESVKIEHTRDTLVQRDSVYHYIKGDTVLIERWHYLQGTSNVLRVDTLLKTDSVQVPVEVVREVTHTETIEKPLKWWQKTLMWIGGVCVLFFGFRLVMKTRTMAKM